MWTDSKLQYGNISKLFHWLTVLLVIGLFALGYWMVDLNYYSQWYKTAPHWHKSIGILLLLMTIFRLGWRCFTPSPNAIESHSRNVQVASKLMHSIIYLILLGLMLSGYLISTADGRAIEIFSWIVIPALDIGMTNQEDIAGVVHQYLAYLLIGLSLLHAVAAVKHHLIDKDQTLRRMTY